MSERSLSYFTCDVHLGLEVGNPSDRESRFVDFLRSIPRDRTQALYLLGDIWDFWYEYRDVVPKGYVRVFAELMDLIEAGVQVYFFKGNHDMWCKDYITQMGIKIVEQPMLVELGGKVFCIGHGDGLGPGMKGYKLMRWGFRAGFFRFLFSLLHPWIAYRLGKGWSKRSRLAKNVEYDFCGEEEPLYKWCEAFAAANKVDYFVFGHYHVHRDLTLPSEERLIIIKDWIEQSPYLYFDGISGELGYSPKTEK